MSFPQKMAAAATLVEARLDALLAQSCIDGTPDRLNKAMRHAVMGGGKRFRPFLLIESAALFGLNAPEAANAAAALECLHCYSLVHDDLPAMDDDDMRRGQPTVHRAFDEWTAILAGDSLLTLAFEILAAQSCHPDPSVRSALILALARAAGPAGMAGGQALDLEADKLGSPAVATIAHIERLQAMKTGRLIMFACEAGALLGRATPDQHSALQTYGHALGVAFQISDDILDAEGDASTVGKATGKDEAAGKATLVSLIGLDNARLHLQATIATAEKALKPFGPSAATLTEAARFIASRKK